MTFPIGSTPKFTELQTAGPVQNVSTSAATGTVTDGEQGATGQQRVANAQLGNAWSDISSGSSYKTMFGDQSYVKNGSDPQLLSMLQTALSKAPELQGTALAQHVSMGKVGPEDVKTLQSFLESKGYSCGAPGVDGKYGPLTHNALDRFLQGLPPGGDTQNRGASHAPGATPNRGAAQSHRPGTQPQQQPRQTRPQAEPETFEA